MKQIYTAVRESRSPAGAWFNIAICLLFLGGMGFMFVMTPRILDDLWYVLQLKPWFESQGMDFPFTSGNILTAPGAWEGIRQVCLDHYYTDNIRLANMVAPFLLVVPLWIGKVLSIIVLGYVIVAMFRRAGIDDISSPLISVGIVALIFVLPWTENMVVLDYQLNYIWPTGLALWLMGILESTGKSRERPTLLRLAGIFLLSIVTGAWHEGIASPVLGALVIMSIIWKEYRRRDVIVAEVGLLLGLLYLTLSPGMRLRIEAGVNPYVGTGELLRYAVLALWTLLGILLFLYANRGKLKNAFTADKKSLFLIIGCLISYGIMIRVNSPGRAGWWCRLAGIILILHELQRYWGTRWSDWRRVPAKPLFGLLLLFGLTRIGLGDYYIVKFRAAWPGYIRAYYEGNRNTAFGHVYTSRDISPLAFYMPFERFPNEAFMWTDIYTRRRDEGREGLIGIVPEELRNVTATSGHPLRGNLGARMKDGHIYMPWEGEAPYLVSATFDYGYGPKRMYSRLFAFESESDGRQYAYVLPYANWFQNYFGRPESMAGPVDTLSHYEETHWREINYY